jgi:hypothetical protein
MLRSYGNRFLPYFSSMTHDQLQAACHAWAWNTYPHMRRRYYSVPNSATGFMGRIKAQQQVALGLIAGVWDMPVYDDQGAAHWIEFKVDGDSISDSQWKFYRAMQPLGNQFFYEVREICNFQLIFGAIATNKQEILQKIQIIV